MNILVIPRGSKWAVTRTGAKRALRLFDELGPAIRFARQKKEWGYGLTVFGRDGRVRMHRPAFVAKVTPESFAASMSKVIKAQEDAAKGWQAWQ